jgi:hypothetical protein
MNEESLRFLFFCYDDVGLPFKDWSFPPLSELRVYSKKGEDFGKSIDRSIDRSPIGVVLYLAIGLSPLSELRVYSKKGEEVGKPIGRSINRLISHWCRSVSCFVKFHAVASIGKPDTEQCILFLVWGRRRGNHAICMHRSP